jgi:hypothetical protein
VEVLEHGASIESRHCGRLKPARAQRGQARSVASPVRAQAIGITSLPDLP